MDLGLKDRVAIVGGASQGIGYAIAHLLATEGASVAMVSRREEPLSAAAKRVQQETGSQTLAIQGDIRKSDDCDRIVERTQKHFRRLDVLVNNDGAPPLGELESFDDTAWEKAVERNLMSVVRLTRRALPLMRDAGWGRIINITALSVLQPLPRFGLSVATWSGVIGFAKTLSLEIAAAGITINTICPGRVTTPRLGTVFGSGLPGGITDTQLSDMAKQIPMQRLGTTGEIAGLVAFLSSEWAAYITGCVFHIDGGSHSAVR